MVYLPFTPSNALHIAKINCMKSFTMLYWAHCDRDREKANMTPSNPKIRCFTLSTCSHCNRTKRFFKDMGLAAEFTDVDLLTGAEREQIMDEVRKLNPDCSFPTICIGEAIIIGFNEEKLRKALEQP